MGGVCLGICEDREYHTTQMSGPAVHLLVELMAWYRRRFGHNPSRNWPPRRASRLTYDMSDQSLNGVRLEGPILEASVFGPADFIFGDRSLFDLIYYDLGLEIGFMDQKISDFRVFMEPVRRLNYTHKPAEFALKTPDGLSHVLSGTTHENTMIRLLGKPDETGPVAEYRMHTFITGRNLILSSHDPDSGRLIDLILGKAADPKEQQPS